MGKLNPLETQRKQALWRKAQRQGWCLLPDDSAELQALAAKEGKAITVQRYDLGSWGTPGISYSDIHVHDASGQPTKALACTVKFGKDKSKSNKEIDNERHDDSD